MPLPKKHYTWKQAGPYNAYIHYSILLNQGIGRNLGSTLFRSVRARDLCWVFEVCLFCADRTPQPTEDRQKTKPSFCTI